ncbi:hypothetical protein SNK04_007863 [Fusarium graminearum]
MSGYLSPSPATVSRRSGETSSGRSSNSRLSTTSVVSLFAKKLQVEIQEGFHKLDDLLSWETYQRVTEDDLRKFREYEATLFNIFLRRDVQTGVSLDARMKGNKKVVVIGCVNSEIKKEVKSILKDKTWAIKHHIKNNMKFHDVEVNLDFNGHNAKMGISSAMGRTEATFTKYSSLGARLRIHGAEMNEATTTMGGVILVDGRPYGLTTGCAMSRHYRESASMTKAEAHTSEAERIVETESAPIEVLSLDEGQEDMDSKDIPADILPGRVIAYVYPGAGPIQERQFAKEQCMRAGTSELSSAEMCETFQSSYSFEGRDWALVEILDDKVPPNSMLNLAKRSSPEWLWPAEEGGKEVFAQATVSESDLIAQMAEENGKVACLTYASALKPIPGFIVEGRSSILLDGAIFSVLRVYMSSPLNYGDSGSWVMVGNSVCGVIIAGSSTNPTSKIQVFRAYMIPITDIFDSISQTLSTKVTLPTLIDYRINFLQTQRRTASYTPNTPHQRYLDMELLLGQRKQQTQGIRDIAELEVHTRYNNASITSSLPLKLGWPYRFVLEDLTDLHYETIDRLLPLGEICPLSVMFRPGFRQWARDYRKSRFQNRRSLVCTIIIDRYLQTEAGENLLGLLIVLWRIEREPLQTRKRTTKSRSHRIAWLAQLLSALCSSMKIPKTAIPSTEQLHIFVYCVISAFKDKDLKHLYLIEDANYQVEMAKPSSGILSPSFPSRHTAFHRAWKAISGKDNEDDLLNVNSALSQGLERPTTWDHTIASTAHMLVTLHNLHRGDRSQVLVYSGLSAAWVGFYAGLVLGLEIQFRKRDTHRTYLDPHLHETPKRVHNPDMDVIIYLTEQPLKVENVFEVIDRRSVSLTYALNRGKSVVRNKPVETNTTEGSSKGLTGHDNKISLHKAIENKEEEIVRQLLNSSEINPNAKDDRGRIPLCIAVEEGNEEIIKLLLNKDKVEPNVKDKNGRTPLSLALANGYEEVARIFIAKGADITVRDENGQTPLSLASGNGHKEMVRILIERGAAVNDRDKNGQTPLSLALANGYEEVARILIENGAEDTGDQQCS